MAKNPRILIPLTLLLILTILSPITAIPPETLTNAAETLQNSGYIAMSLTLNENANSLLSETTSATIFAPPDLIFAHFGQPSLSLVQYHFSPLIFSSSSLRSLITRTRIPTMLSDHYLVITSTSSSNHISINNVRVTDSPVFDDGILAVYGVENFFDPDFRVADAPAPNGGGNGCRKVNGGDHGAFHDAGNVLISRGYSVMASFLNLQLLGLGFEESQSQSQRNGLTIFAPVDEVMVDYSDRFPDYPSLFLRHVLPCKVSLNELVSIENGSVLSVGTFLNGFRVNVTRSGVTLKANEVNIVFPDMYYSDWLVIHGISDVISVLELEEDFDESDDDLSEPISPVGSSRGPDGDL
ncbi:FAS1 domain-containing protein [Artemisia annua]|uniref:FAS1 domain-containing protein n=1 Tax=Artemisia annua TaxID=35608 RepID=A0A2U1LSL1_ARTAN|nr:FAS1 domain-containing protein [Artemisia annua]